MTTPRKTCVPCCYAGSRVAEDSESGSLADWEQRFSELLQLLQPCLSAEACLCMGIRTSRFSHADTVLREGWACDGSMTIGGDLDQC